MFVHRDKAHIFWFTSQDQSRYRKVNHILSTGPDGRAFTQDQVLKEDWISERGVDVRHGTHLRDGRVLLPIAWMEPVGEFDPDTWVAPKHTFHRYNNFGWGGIAENNVYCVGVMEPNDDFTSFTRYGRVRKETPGEVRVEVVNRETTQAYPGFEREQCLPVTDDAVAAPVRWANAHLATLVGQPVMLRFILEPGARVHAIRFGNGGKHAETI